MQVERSLVPRFTTPRRGRMLAAVGPLLGLSCVAWQANLEESAGFFVRVTLEPAVLDRTFESTESAAILVLVDDQEPEVVANICSRGDGDVRLWRDSASPSEPLEADTSFTIAANLQDCGNTSTVRVQVWSEARQVCADPPNGTLPDAQRIELLFEKQREVGPDEQTCASSAEASIGIITENSPDIEPIEIPLTIDDEL